MADQNHVEILESGMDTWNKWRKKNPLIRPDLRNAFLSDWDLSKYNLLKTDFNGASLCNANLSESNLYYSNLIGVDLSNANLEKAFCIAANFMRANLRKANLSEATLRESILTNTNLDQAKMYNVTFGWTTFGNVDLSSVEGLESVKHDFPSFIDLHTFYNSKGEIPDNFLIGAGLPPKKIGKYNDSHVSYFSCFISYSNEDAIFVKKLRRDLMKVGVRCWYAPEDIKIGDKFRQVIDDSIRQHDKLLIVFSENSLKSVWVEKEIETAFEEERKQKKILFFPIRIDNFVMDTNQSWAADVRKSRHIGDFRNWEQDEAYKNALNRLKKALKAG